MIPILYPYDETAFTTRGIGPLSDCIDCSVTEVLNGEYSLTMKYPKNGINQDALEIRNIIVCQPNHTTERQAFRICKVNRSMKDSITVYAYQLSYDLNGYIASPPAVVTTESLNLRESAPSGSIIRIMHSGEKLMILDSTTISSVVWYKVRTTQDEIGWCQSDWVSTGEYPFTADTLAEAVTNLDLCCGDFNLSTNKTSNADFTVNMPSSVRSWFGGKEGSLLDIYGGEWKYDMLDCQFLSQRGSDNGARLSDRVNIAEYVKERTDNAYSHIVPYFYKQSEDVEIVVKGDAIATGFTGIQRTLFLDVTGQLDSEYGKVITGFDTFGKSQKSVNGSQFVDISTSSFYSHIRLSGSTSWAQMSTDNGYVAKEWAYPNNSGLISSPATTLAGGGSVFTAKEGINYQIKASSFSPYCQLVVVFTDSNGTVISQAQYSYSSVTSGISVIAPSGSAFIVLVPIVTSSAAASMSYVTAYQNMTLTSAPTVAEVTAQGTAYFAVHPELATDTQTISVKPDLINTEVSLGDTVHVAYDNELISTRVVKTIWNVLAEKYDALEIGTIKQNIAQTIKNLR